VKPHTYGQKDAPGFLFPSQGFFFGTLVTQLPNNIVDINFPGVLKRATISAAGVFFMWSSVVEDLVDRLIPEGGKGLLGKAEVCRECEGRGYTRKNQNVWQTCHKCYAGRCWIPVADNHKVSKPIP
jgi:hypothetical protein